MDIFASRDDIIAVKISDRRLYLNRHAVPDLVSSPYLVAEHSVAEVGDEQCLRGMTPHDHSCPGPAALPGDVHGQQILS